MSANPRKIEWMMAVAGILNAAPTYTLVLFLVLLTVEENQVQVNEDAIGLWVLGFSVPIGALVGVLVCAYSLRRRSIIDPNRSMLAGSWFVATLCAYPVSCLWMGIFSFSMPGHAAAAALSAIYVLIALVLCAACSLLVQK